MIQKQCRKKQNENIKGSASKQVMIHDVYLRRSVFWRAAAPAVSISNSHLLSQDYSPYPKQGCKCRHHAQQKPNCRYAYKAGYQDSSIEKQEQGISRVGPGACADGAHPFIHFPDFSFLHSLRIL